MKETIITILVVALGVFAGLWGYSQVPQPLGGSGLGAQSCVASTTAWSIGPQETKTVLPARSQRATFQMSHTGVNTTAYYRLDSTAPTAANAHHLAASTTVIYDEKHAYKGQVRVMSLASSTLIVTECIY